MFEEPIQRNSRQFRVVISIKPVTATGYSAQKSLTQLMNGIYLTGKYQEIYGYRL
jgi:hypothetical protein